MTDREMKIAEIRQGYKSDKNDNSFTYKKETVERDIQFLLSELEHKDEENRKLREGLRNARKELYRRYWEADRKWESEADLYENGKAAAYEVADMLIENILKEIGVNEDANTD
jgi:hypothetical protein